MKYLGIVLSLLICVISVYASDLVSPLNGTVANENAIEFKWNPTDSNSTYRLQVATDSFFTLIVADVTVGSPSATVNLPLSNTRYFWRVTYSETSLPTAWSHWYSYTVFSPKDLPNLTLWISASDSVKVDGLMDVDTIYDLSGSNNHVYQNLVAQRPTLSSIDGTINNKRSLRFNVNSHPNQDRLIISNALTFDNSHIFCFGKKDSPTDNVVYLGSSSSNRYQANLFSGAFYTILSSGSASFATGHFLDYKISSFKYDGTTAGLKVNLANVGSNPLSSSIDFNIIGKRRGNTQSTNGNICEMVYYDTTLTASQELLVENYLYYKYSPPVSLGCNIITCAFDSIILEPNHQFVSYTWQDGSTNPTFRVDSAGKYFVTATDILGITSSDTIDIVIDTANYNYIPVNDTGFCSGSDITITAGPAYYNYMWSTGDTTQAITINTTGTYSIQITDCPGNVINDTFNITSIDNSFDLGNDTTICLGDSLTIGRMLTNPVSYSWNTGAAAPFIKVADNGQYILSVNDGFGCAYADTINVIVDSTFFGFTLGNDTSLCQNNTIAALSDTSLSYLWSTGDTTYNTTISVTNDYSIVTTNTNGCQGIDTINVVVVGAAPIVNFDFGVICINDSISFSDNSTTMPPSTNVQWVWSFGDGNVDTTMDAKHLYAAIGTYNVTLEVLNSVGCNNTNTQTITIGNPPIANFTKDVVCAQTNVPLFDLSTFSGIDSINYWHWDFGNGDTTTGKNPVYQYPSQGIYYVTLTVTTINGCQDTYIDSLEVFPALLPDFETQFVCNGDSTLFIDKTPSLSIVDWQWSFGDGFGFSSAPHPFYQYGSVDTFPVSLQVINAIGCTSIIAKDVIIYDLPTVAFDSTFGCLNSLVTLYDSSSADDGIATWEWVINASDTFNTQNVNYVAASQGMQNAALTVTSTNGCIASTTGVFEIFAPPTAQFIYTPNFGAAPLPVNFINQSVGGSSYSWSFGDGNSDISVNPSNTYITNDTFNATLVTTNIIGCVDTISKQVVVRESEIDLAITRLAVNENPIGTNTSEIELTARLENVGSRNITSAKILVTLNDGTTFSEDWTGNLAIGQLVDYTLNTKAIITNETQKQYLCVEAINVNTSGETILHNNRQCTSLDNQMQVFGPYPSPADEVATFDIIMPYNSSVDISVFDILGQKVEVTKSHSLIKGSNVFTLYTNHYFSDEYILFIELGGNKISKKFTVMH